MKFSKEVAPKMSHYALKYSVKKPQFFVAFPWVEVTSTGRGGFMICVCIL